MELELKVIAGPACAPSLVRDIEASISELRGEPFAVTPWDDRCMKDGEIVPRILKNVRGCDVYVVQPTNMPAINHQYLKLLLQAATLASAFSVTAVLPYMGGLRQDRKDQPRVPITAKQNAREIEKAMLGAPRRHVMIMHPHFPQVQGFFDIPSDLLYPTSIFIEKIMHIVGDQLARVLPISPDAGGAKLAEYYMRRMDLSAFAIGDKHREKKTEQTRVRNIIGLIQNAIGTAHDDIVDTAGSYCSLCQKALELGIAEMYGFITHGVLPKGAIENVRASGTKKLFITDSIMHDPGYLPEDLIEVVPCGRLIGEAIFRNNTNDSISEMAGMF